MFKNVLTQARNEFVSLDVGLQSKKGFAPIVTPSAHVLTSTHDLIVKALLTESIPTMLEGCLKAMNALSSACFGVDNLHIFMGYHEAIRQISGTGYSLFTPSASRLPTGAVLPIFRNP